MICSSVFSASTFGSTVNADFFAAGSGPCAGACGGAEAMPDTPEAITPTAPTAAVFMNSRRARYTGSGVTSEYGTSADERILTTTDTAPLAGVMNLITPQTNAYLDAVASTISSLVRANGRSPFGPASAATNSRPLSVASTAAVVMT